MTDPYPKDRQLSRGQKRYPRKVATRKQWEAMSVEKRGPCRVCREPRPVTLHLHHVVMRGDFGDDVAANLVPLCGDCHADLHNRNGQVCRLFVANLSDDEYAYAVTKAGEDYLERVYGIEYKP